MTKMSTGSFYFFPEPLRNGRSCQQRQEQPALLTPLCQGPAEEANTSYILLLLLLPAVKHSKLIRHRATTVPVQKAVGKLSQMSETYDPCSFEIIVIVLFSFWVPSSPSVLLMMCLNAGIHILFIICGRQRYVGRRWFVSVRFLESPVAAFVGNGSIRAAIFIQRLGCLNAENGVCNCKRD